MSDYSKKIFEFISAFLRNSAGVEVGTLANPLRVDPTNTTPQDVNITGTVTATVGNINTLGTITNPVTVQQATAGNLKVDLSGTAANSTALNAAVTGSVSVSNLPATQPVSGTVTVIGSLTHNNAAPAATTNIGALIGVASAVAPTYVEGDQVLLSTTLAGSVRAQVSGLKTTNTQAPGSTNLGVLPVVANASAPTYSEGFQVGMSSDLSGNLRIGGTVTANQGVAPWSQNITQVGGAAVVLGQQVSSASIPVSISSDVMESFQQMLGELRVMRAAIVKMACEDGRAQPEDFNQAHSGIDSENDPFIN